MSSTITTEIIREIQTAHHINNAIVNTQNMEFVEKKTVCFDITTNRVDDIQIWHIVCGRNVLLSLPNERLIRQTAQVILRDIKNYVIQRWRIR